LVVFFFGKFLAVGVVGGDDGVRAVIKEECRIGFVCKGEGYVFGFVNGSCVGLGEG
jgi:hypothetical protein